MNHPVASSRSDKPRARRRAPRLWGFAAAAILALGASTGAVATPLLSASSAVDAPAALTAGAPIDSATALQPDTAPAVTADASRAKRTALDVLATLPVKGKAPKTGYNRTTKFGQAWLDVDRNGCDTRNDILGRDLRAVVRSGPCKVLRGTLAEPYTGRTMQFVRGTNTSALVQIDHVVALSNSWQTGAQKLTQAQRITLANDPLNLLAADGRANAQKGAGDAATWLPSAKSFRCSYVARQVSVKAAYRLWVAPAERDAMKRVLSSCPRQPALTSSLAPGSAPAPAPAPPAAPPVVHPGAYCSPEGALGVTSAGTPMVCGKTANSPDRARWHRR